MKRIWVIGLLSVISSLVFTSCKDKDENKDENKGVGIDTSATEELVFVSKQPGKIKILLEEYTGHKCVYCPDGHLRANALVSQYADQLYTINVHASSLATPNTSGTQYRADYRTNFGNFFLTYYGITGVPAGIINRSYFTVNGKEDIVLNRGYWASVVASISNRNSYVNVAAKTTITTSTRKLECKVQAYYTDTTSKPNYINVALIQNEIIGDQTGSNYNPNYITTDGKYRHMHMLRHLLTGQWGEAMAIDRKTGTLYKQTFTYTLPESINGVALDIANLEIIVFITEGVDGKGTIITTNKSECTVK
jgi:hypothetical protein